MSTPPRPAAAVSDGGDRDRSRYPWPFFVAMLAAFFLFFSIQSLFPLSPLYVLEVGGSSADNGLMTWAFALAALLTRPVAGILADRWGRKPVLVLGALLFGGGPLLHVPVSSVTLLLVVKAIYGVGMALFTTTYQAFVADQVPPGRYGEGLGIANMAASVAMIAAPLFGEWIVGARGFTLAFLVCGAIGGMGWLTALVLPGRKSSPASRSHGKGQETPLLAEEGNSTPESGGGLWGALKRPGVRAGALGMALLGMPFGAFITFLPLLVDERGLGGAGVVLSVYALFGMLVRPIAGRAADRWSPFNVVLVGLVLIALSVAGLAVVANWWAMMGLAALFGAAFGTVGAALDAIVQGSVGPSLRGSASALQYAAFDLLVAFGSLGLGMVAAAAGYGVMYAAVSGVVMTGLLVGGLASVWRRQV